MASSARFTNGSLEITLDLPASLLGCRRRTMHIPAECVVRTYGADSRDVATGLRWKIAGVGLPRGRLMGWFSRRGHRGRWAWVWMTPGRKLICVETTLRHPALVVVPRDWFDAENLRGLWPQSPML